METKPTNVKIATKWAVIYTITTIVITYGTELLNLDPNSPVKYLSYLPFIAFCFLAQKEFKDQLGGYITFGQAFNTGFKYSLFSGFLLAIFFYVYLAFLNPGALDKAAEQQQTVLAEKNMSQEQIDQAIEMTKKYGALFGAVAAAIGSLISGCIIALVTAAILKKERSPYDAVDTTADEPAV
ncbi:DUF4199 domain-containing protein [Mucilaginibacter sp.]|uniref:DUF4199 domain-containing protein n=1 Tax=Mucilaginibacter sp. TaxID=1882438 RepID=UPI003263DDBD